MAKQLTRSAVRIYGALTGLGNGTGDVLEALLPFFEPLLRSKSGTALDPTKFAIEVRDTYKWNFNSDLVEAFVPYFVEKGWLIPNIPGSNSTNYTIQVTDSAHPDESAASIETELRRIAEDFREFSIALSPLTVIPRDVEEFEDILVEWLLYVEAFSLKSVDFRSGFRSDATGTP